MPYIRLTIARPHGGNGARALEIMNELSTIAAKEDGFLESWVLKPHDDSGDLARIAVWRDEHAADAAANTARFLSLRSELHLIVEPGHIERGFFTV